MKLRGLLTSRQAKSIGYEVLFAGDDTIQRLTVEQFNLLNSEEKSLITQQIPIYSEKHSRKGKKEESY